MNSPRADAHVCSGEVALPCTSGMIKSSSFLPFLPAVHERVEKLDHLLSERAAASDEAPFPSASTPLSDAPSTSRKLKIKNCEALALAPSHSHTLTSTHSLPHPHTHILTHPHTTTAGQTITQRLKTYTPSKKVTHEGDS